MRLFICVSIQKIEQKRQLDYARVSLFGGQTVAKCCIECLHKREKLADHYFYFEHCVSATVHVRLIAIDLHSILLTRLFSFIIDLNRLLIVSIVNR